MTDPSCLVAALAYAARGWPVFPCTPDGKTPATAHGCKDATVDPCRIRAWWRARPDANVAIATGFPAVDVLDVDVKPGGSGFPAFRRLVNAGLLAGAVALVNTPSGGLHVYFAGTQQGNGSLPRHRLDFRGRGGYVLAVPSTVDGRPYTWAEHRDVTPSRLDCRAVKALLDPPPAPAPRTFRHTGSADALVRWVARQAEGSRNNALYWAACRAVESGNADALGDLVSAAVFAGLGEAEARRTVASAAKRMEGALT